MWSLKLILINRNRSICSIYKARSKQQVLIILSAKIHSTFLELVLTQNIQESRGITCPFPVSSLTRVKTCLISMWRWTYQQLANIIIHLIETLKKLPAFARVRLSDGDLCHFERCPVFEPLHCWSRISRNSASQFHGCFLVHCFIRKTENRWRKNIWQEKENHAMWPRFNIKEFKKFQQRRQRECQHKRKSQKSSFTMWNQTTRMFPSSFGWLSGIHLQKSTPTFEIVREEAK